MLNIITNNEIFVDKMEFNVFLLGGGLALFIALLGWSDHFRQPSRETRIVEKMFMKKLKLKLSEIAPIIRNTVKEMKVTDQSSFLAEIKSMTQILVSKKIKDKYDIELVNEFKDVETKANKLYELYNLKYYLTVFLTIVFFLGGISSTFYGSLIISILQNIRVDIVSFTVPMILIMIIILLLLKINNLEINFRNKVKELSESIEVR